MFQIVVENAFALHVLVESIIVQELQMVMVYVLLDNVQFNAMLDIN